MTVRMSDLLVGSAIGAVGGLQGIALPGLLIVGLGFDASVAAAHTINPTWFPGADGLTLEEVFATALGTIAGWGVAKLVAPHVNPAVVPIASAGLALMPIPGRVPGRMRYASYRWMR